MRSFERTLIHGSFWDITDGGSLDHVTDSKSLDCFVLWYTSRAVGAAHESDVAAAFLVATAISPLFRLLCKGGQCWVSRTTTVDVAIPKCPSIYAYRHPPIFAILLQQTPVVSFFRTHARPAYTQTESKTELTMLNLLTSVVERILKLALAVKWRVEWPS